MLIFASDIALRV